VKDKHSPNTTLLITVIWQVEQQSQIVAQPVICPKSPSASSHHLVDNVNLSSPTVSLPTVQGAAGYILHNMCTLTHPQLSLILFFQNTGRLVLTLLDATHHVSRQAQCDSVGAITFKFNLVALQCHAVRHDFREFDNVEAIWATQPLAIFVV
jgi:hypothetical protein